MSSVAPSMVFDLDGTLCFDGVGVAAPIIRAIDRVIAAGRPVAFASARPIRDMLPLLPAAWHGHLLIGANGALVRHGRQSAARSFGEVDRRELDAIIERHQLAYLIDSPWDYSYTGPTGHRLRRQVDPGGLARNLPRRHLKRYCKVLLFSDAPQVLDCLSRLQLVAHRHTGQGLIDLSPGRTTKAEAAAQWLAGPFVAFGNDANDAQLFTAAQFSVCVGSHPVAGLADLVIAEQQVSSTITAVHERLLAEASTSLR
ncbi:HAD-IIB family hydrolase [Glutamicibacter creatinolyticus]|nr:HAD-IIB family hydrolase [Glutamicibacter creatinolyticus]